MPTATTILMIRPAAFGFNAETANNNFFQLKQSQNKNEIHLKALNEFDAMVNLLREKLIDVLVIEDTQTPIKPSAIFPNNWLSTSPDGKVFVYPMYAVTRRNEKRDDILKLLAEKYVVTDVQDWSEYEAEGRFLEGTGSMMMDHDNKMIYAAISERTSPAVLEKFASANGFSAVVFLAKDKNDKPVYHTNVVMALGQNFCVLCEEAIDEEWELIAVKQLLESTGHEIIAITIEQMHCFAGNMLEVKNKNDDLFLIMSCAAFDSLTDEQKEKLQFFAQLLPVAIPTIEAAEGGSVRCMMAEIFLEKK
jgi:hypothetical protein